MPFKVEDYMVRLLMKVTASQAVKTTAKLQTIGKQLSLIGTNLLSGKYASVQDLKRVRASVVNASNIARRANDQILDGVSSKRIYKTLFLVATLKLWIKLLRAHLK